MTALREVTIVVSNIKAPLFYIAKSYPCKDFDRNGQQECYRVPIYKAFIDGTSANGRSVRKEWTALRFMPYWNDPKNPSKHYTIKGWVNAGLRSLPKKAVSYYDPNYMTRNRRSPYSGGIQMIKSFLIHAGPANEVEFNWGSAGCVEIIGDFGKFKDNIKELSGSTQADAHGAILELVKARKLYVQVDYATPPDIKADFLWELPKSLSQ
jgi:hypothetical protein